MPDYKIMIVEDEEIVAADIKMNLEKMGYSVCATASSGLEAIEKAELTRPDLVLMDIVLKGGMDGIEVARQIKELYEIPVVYLTAFGDDSILQKAKVAEPYGYITKPFRYRELHIAIEIALYKKQAEAEKAILESQNRQLQKAESLGRMAGAIAHHFNNQLGSVVGNLDLAMMELSQGKDPHAKITEAIKASNRAVEMGGLMLTYLGQSFDKHDSMLLSVACLRCLTLLRVALPGNVVMDADLPTPGPVISANANQIQQILINLVTNALEAVVEGRGVIHLTVGTVSPADIPAAHRFPAGWQPQYPAYAFLEVKDTGCGIEDKDIENIFDPFFSNKFTGRGMGLAVVLGIVRNHRGVITVMSEPGCGSTFRVFIPVSWEEVIWQPDKVGDDEDGLAGAASPIEIEKGGTVLLIEDEEIVRNMAAAMLKRLGFSVFEAKDGVEALEVFRQRQDEIRCVLCDLTMPRMNGWETLTALRKLAPDIPVILASGYDKTQVMAGEHPELPKVFLGKPYRLKGLSDAISQALNKK